MAYEGMAMRDQETGYTLARGLAMETVNPINWYKYFPGRFNISQGRIHVPFISGRSMRSIWSGEADRPGWNRRFSHPHDGDVTILSV